MPDRARELWNRCEMCLASYMHSSSKSPKVDCRHYCGDRPCTPHKREGVVCNDCRRYDPCWHRILIIKLAADGDVLRTTCLLPSLRMKYPSAHITWVTERSAEPLLRNNPLVDRIWAPPEKFLLNLTGEQFDLVLNSDTDPSSCHLAGAARGRRKLGFIAGAHGEPLARGRAAECWHQMGIWDHLKQANRKTYPTIIHEIAGVSDSGSRPLLSLTAEEIIEAQRALARKGWRPSPGRTVVGINTGAGVRWPEKSLPMETLEGVVGQLAKRKDLGRMLLFGGPSERERNQHLSKKFGAHVVDTGTENSVRQFAALMSQADVLLVADTLALHVGLALRKYVVAHFGPTSPWEIDLYGFGEKIVPATDSVGCYCNGCVKTPKCNELISSTTVTEAIFRGLAASCSAPRAAPGTP